MARMTTHHRSAGAGTGATADKRGAGVLALLVLYAAVFLISAEARVIAPLLPAIATEFGTTAS